MPAAAPRGSVTILARLGGLLLALVGILWALIGGAFVAGGALFKGFFDVNTLPALGDAVGGAVATIGVILLVFAIIEILAGLGGMLGANWARAVGILYAFVFGGFSLLILLNGAGRRDVADTGALIFFIAHVVVYAYVLVVFLVRWRGRATA